MGVDPVARINLTALFAYALLIISGCFGGDFTLNLPNGYVLASTNDHTTAILSSPTTPHSVDNGSGVAIAAKIFSYAVVEERYVVGLVITSPKSELARFEHCGWFLLDTKEHVITWFVTENGLRDALRRDFDLLGL